MPCSLVVPDVLGKRVLLWVVALVLTGCGDAQVDPAAAPPPAPAAAAPPAAPAPRSPVVSEEARARFRGTWVVDQAQAKSRLAQAIDAAVPAGATKHERDVAGELALARLQAEPFTLTLRDELSATITYVFQEQPATKTGTWLVAKDGDLLVRDPLVSFAWWFHPTETGLEIVPKDATVWLALSGVRGFYGERENVPLVRR